MRIVRMDTEELMIYLQSDEENTKTKNLEIKCHDSSKSIKTLCSKDTQRHRDAVY